MAITAISRDWGVEPSIVRITTTDDLAAITTAGYLTAQATNIELLQNGDFEWVDSDFILIYYSDGEGFFVRDALNETFDAAPAVPGSLSDTLQDGDIFVGNASNVATGVTPSGDITLTNAGVFGIASGAIVNADISNTARIDFVKLANLPSADILVGNGSNNAAAVAMTGDIGITNAGVTAIQAGVIVNADVASLARIDFAKLAVLPSANILVGNVSNNAASVAMTGDVTIDNAGVTTIGAGTVFSGNLDNSLVKFSTTVNITAAQFKALYDTPVQILANNAANRIIVVHRALLVMTYGGTAFTDGGVLSFQYDSTVHGAGVLATNSEAAADFFAAVSTSYSFVGVSGNTIGALPLSTTVAKGLYLSNLTQNFATGNSTFAVQVWYSIIPTA